MEHVTITRVLVLFAPEVLYIQFMNSQRMLSWVLLSCLSVNVAQAAPPDANRFTYLYDQNPYYVNGDFPKIITPQWVGEEGVDGSRVVNPSSYWAHAKSLRPDNPHSRAHRRSRRVSPSLRSLPAWSILRHRRSDASCRAESFPSGS